MGKCSALTLGVIPFSETSFVVTLLTREHGRLSVLAKGARRKKGGGAVCFEVFAQSEILLRYRKNRDMQTLSGWSLQEYFGAIRENGLLLSAAGVAMELTRKTVQPGLPLPAVYDLTLAFLTRLNGAGAKPRDYSEKLIWLYLLGFLRAMGFAPGFGEGMRHVFKTPVAPVVRRELALLESSHIDALEPVVFRHGRAINKALAEFLTLCFEKNLNLNCLDFYYRFY